MRNILKQKVYHDGTSMVVLKPGMKHDVPERLVQTWIDEGVIAGKTSKQITAEKRASDEAAAKEAAEREAAQREAAEKAAREKAGEGSSDGDNPFSFEHSGGGYYAVSGPGLDEPERVQGKEAAEARAAALWADSKSAGDDDGAPTV